jgi:hypothetical protein
MKVIMPYIIVFLVSLALCTYNTSSPITITLIAGIVVISIFCSLLLGTVALLAMRIAKGIS